MHTTHSWPCLGSRGPPVLTSDHCHIDTLVNTEQLVPRQVQLPLGRRGAIDRLRILKISTGRLGHRL